MPRSASRFLLAALVAACAAAARVEAQGTRVQSIRITATIAAPVEGLAVGLLAPDLQPMPGPRTAARAGSARTSLADAAVDGAAAAERVTAALATPPAPDPEAAPAVGARRYRVVVRLAADGALPDGVTVTVADAEGRERPLEPGRVVTIARCVTASEARSAVVRLRIRNGSVQQASVPAIPLVYEVTSESALAM